MLGQGTFFCRCFCYLVQFRLAVGIERNLEAGFANGLDFPKVSRQLEELQAPIEGLDGMAVPFQKRRNVEGREAVRLCACGHLTLIRNELIGVIDGQKRRV